VALSLLLCPEAKARKKEMKDHKTLREGRGKKHGESTMVDRVIRAKKKSI